jgi:hypothetical protein
MQKSPKIGAIMAEKDGNLLEHEFCAVEVVKKTSHSN